MPAKSKHPPSQASAPSDSSDVSAILDDEELEAIDDEDEVSTIPSDPLDVEASEPPGADTAGLDAAPTEQATRVGAGSAGDLTGMDEEESLASDDDGSDGSDILIEDGETDPDRPKDLVDLMDRGLGSEAPARP